MALSLAAAAIVFLFWVEAHRNLENEHHRQMSKTSIDDLIGHTVFEIFDSVIFLDMIIPENQAEIENDARNISAFLKTTILVLATVNFLMPGLGLYRLSRTHFGEKSGQLKITHDETGLPSTRGLGTSVVYHLLRLCAVNIPYLIIRIHLSENIGKDLTIFIFKNILGIWVSLRTLFPEIKEWIRVHKWKQQAKLERSKGVMRPSIKVDVVDPARGWEMAAVEKSNQRNKGYDQRRDSNTTGNILLVHKVEEVLAEEPEGADAVEEQLQNGLLYRY